MLIRHNSIFFRSFLFDIEGFDDKHQLKHAPTGLITGVIGHVAEKTRDHLLSKQKDSIVGASAPITAPVGPGVDLPETDSESPNATKSKRPTIIDFMSKFKTKRSIDADKPHWGCSAKISIADAIGEHTVDTKVNKNVDETVAPEHELEEVADGGLNKRAKRSNDDDHHNPEPQTSCGTSSCSVLTPPPTTQPQSTCTTCDRIET